MKRSKIIFVSVSLSVFLIALLLSLKYLSSPASPLTSTQHTQTAQVFNSTCTFVCTGLVGYWPFEATSGTVATDASGNNNNGSLISSSSVPVWTTLAKVGSGALIFDGSNAVSIGAITSAVNIPALTVSAWVKGDGSLLSSSGVTGYDIVSKYVGGQGSWYLFYSANSKTYECRVFNSDRDTATARGAPIQNDDTAWHHVACVYDGRFVTLYTDGVANTSSAAPLTGNVISRDDSVCIGSQSETGGACSVVPQSNTAPWKGSIDDVRIYNRALVAADVATLFTSTGNSAPAPIPAEIHTPKQDATTSQPLSVNVPEAPVVPLPPVPLTTPVNALVIGGEALQPLPTSAEYSAIINYSPGNGETVGLNPPRFSWLYRPSLDATYCYYPNCSAYAPMEFIFQVADNPQFTNPVVNVLTLNNFYNFIPVLGSGRTYYWRVGYIHPTNLKDSDFTDDAMRKNTLTGSRILSATDGAAAANTWTLKPDSWASAPFLWTSPRSFTISSGATIWDRSKLADPVYLSSKLSQHPFILFTAGTRDNLVSTLDRDGAVMGKSWQTAKADAAKSIASSWWKSPDPVTAGGMDIQTWSTDVG